MQFPLGYHRLMRLGIKGQTGQFKPSNGVIAGAGDFRRSLLAGSHLLHRNLVKLVRQDGIEGGVVH